MGKLLVFALFLLFVLLGLQAVTTYAPSSNQDDSNNDAVKLTALNKDSDKASDGVYDIARTSNGPLTRTVELDFGTIETHKITRSFSNEEAQKLKLNQKLILKDKSNALMDSHGSISSIDSKENNTNVTIQLPESIDVTDVSSKINIITFQSRASHRLPYSTMQFDDTGQAFVWSAELENESNYFIATKRPLGTFYEGSDFFAPKIPKKAYMWFILNPDNTLKDGQKYSFKKTKITAPLHGPLDQAKAKKHLRALKEANAIMQARREACLQREASKGGIPTKNACSGEEKKPLDIINDILKNR